MAKKSMIARNKKRQRLTRRYKRKRLSLKVQVKLAKSLNQRFSLYQLLQKLPRNSSATRIKNRCLITGRPKAYYRDFGLSRHVLREMAYEGLLPGVTKCSW